MRFTYNDLKEIHDGLIAFAKNDAFLPVNVSLESTDTLVLTRAGEQFKVPIGTVYEDITRDYLNDAIAEPEELLIGNPDTDRFVMASVLKQVYNVPNGLATLNESGKIDSEYLPSYVDDVLEFPTLSDFPEEGEGDKIYIALDTNLEYRWSGSTYVPLSCTVKCSDLVPDLIFTSQGNNVYTCNVPIDEIPHKSLLLEINDSGSIYYLRSYGEDVDSGALVSLRVEDYLTIIMLMYDADTQSWTLNTHTFPNVVYSGSYNDLTDKPLAEIAYNKVGSLVLCSLSVAQFTDLNTRLAKVTYSENLIPMWEAVMRVRLSNGDIYVEGIEGKDNQCVFKYAGGTWSVENKTLATISDIPAQEQANWNESDNTSPQYIQNKPTIPANTSELNNDSNFITLNDVPQSNWNQIDSSQTDFIKNKPDIPVIPNINYWRVPTIDEWTYLLFTRSASTIGATSNARYCKCKINIHTPGESPKGLLILPDVFSLPSGITMVNINDSAASFDGNSYLETDYNALLEAGCVFLPLAGYRAPESNQQVQNINSYGFYASSIQNDINNTKYLYISELGVIISYTDDKKHGKSVRFIHDTENGLFSVSATSKVNIAKSNLMYHCLKKKWALIPNGYDIIGADNQYIDANYNGWIDLFGYGTSGWDSGANAYQPWSASNDNTDYLYQDLINSYAEADWGYSVKSDVLAKVAITGDYNDLENKPFLPTFWFGTQQEFDDIVVYDSNTIYFIEIV